jgi:peptidyl-prolyl cis-trans isomerase SurA
MSKIIWCLFFNSLIQIGISQEVIDQVVAIVGENPILYSEIQGQKLQILQQGGELDGNIDCYLIDEFMTQQLLIHQAEIDSLEVTEEMVKVELDQRIQYFSAQVGGTEALEEFYGQSIEEIKEEFFEQIEDKMKAQKMQQEVTGNISVSPSEVRSFFYKIPFDSVPFINSKVKVSQLVIAPEITYGQKEATKKKLQKIKNRIYSNEISFSVAAEFYSNDPGSKANGGNFGWVSRGDFVPEFDAIAYTIPLNTVSDVFESPFGFHILKIEKRRGEQYYGSHILVKNEINEEDLKILKERCNSIFDELRARFLPTSGRGGKVH